MYSPFTTAQVRIFVNVLLSIAVMPLAGFTGDLTFTKFQVGTDSLSGTQYANHYWRGEAISCQASVSYAPTPGSNVAAQLQSGEARLDCHFAWTPFGQNEEVSGESSTASSGLSAVWPSGGEVPVTCTVEYSVKRKITNTLTLRVHYPDGGVSIRVYQWEYWIPVEEGVAVRTALLTEAKIESVQASGTTASIDDTGQTAPLVFSAVTNPPGIPGPFRWHVNGGGETITPPTGVTAYTTRFTTEGTKTIAVSSGDAIPNIEGLVGTVPAGSGSLANGKSVTVEVTGPGGGGGGGGNQPIAVTIIDSPKVLVGRLNTWKAKVEPFRPGGWTWYGSLLDGSGSGGTTQVSTNTFTGMVPMTGQPMIGAYYLVNFSTYAKDEKTPSLFGARLRVAVGRQDDDVTIGNDEAVFRLAATAEAYDNGNIANLGGGTELTWTPDTQQAGQNGDLITSVQDGKAFATVSIPIPESGTAGSRMVATLSKVMHGGQQVQWGQPAPGSGGLQWADYQKRSPLLEVSRKQARLAVNADDDDQANGPDKDNTVIDGNQDLWYDLVYLDTLNKGGAARIKKTAGEGAIRIFDGQSMQQVMGPQQGSVDLTGPLAGNGMYLKAEGVVRGHSTYVIEHVTDSIAWVHVFELDVGADVQLDVDSNNDGVINEKDDPIEEQTPGKLVPISDKQWDLAPMYISVTPSDVKGTVTLKQTGGDGKVRIFDYGSYPLGNPVFDSDLHPDGTQDLWDTMLERDWGRQKSRSRPLKAQGVQEGEVLLAMTYRAGDVVETDSVLLKVVKARRLEFVDKSGSVVEFGTSFSDPFPTVTLQDLNASSFQVTAQTEPNGKKDIVRFQVSGTIKDPLADIVADGAADIARASVTVNGVPLPDNVPFQKVNEAPTPLRPYACHWEFGPVTVYWLLSNGANTFDVSATNAMGNTGSDSLTLTVSIPDYDFVTEDGEEKIADATSMTIEGVENHDSTEQGLYNPILAKVYDPLLDPDETDGVTATFIGAEFPLRVLNASQRQYALDRPILAIVHDSANGKSNLVNLRTATTPMPVSYGGMSKGLHWAFTANSKATQYKFASGTTVDHWVYSDVFDADPAPSISAVNVLNSDNSPASRGTFNVSPTLVSPAPLSGHTRGLKLTIVIPQGAHRPSASATKDLDIVYRASGSNEDQHLPLRQNFAVVPLKIVVCAIDGAGYSTVTDVVSLPDSSNAPRYFNRAFGKALQADPSTRLNNVVLSMLPTITFCNWPSILSGRSPKDTGITGNSFFDRDNTNNSKKVFMGRGTRSDSNSYGYTVVSGHLDEWARSVAPGDSTGGTDSLYAKAADRAGGDTLRAVSINTFYRRGQRPNLKLDATVYPWWPCRRVSTYASWTVPPIALPLIIERYRDLIGHKQRVAKAFDRISATDAIQYWKCPGGALPDITTIYFPGVDTLAHRQGQPDEALNTLIKPNLFENDEYEGLLGPGANQGPFFREWTDRQFGRFLEYVEHRGLQHSILFALVADHGFIHYKTDPAHRLMVQDSNGPELLKLWEPDNAQPAPPLRLLPLFNSQDDVANCRTVYCPNGGMAQLYVRNGQNAWDQAPTDTDIKAVAEAFYWEAVGVDSRDQTGTQVVGDLHNAFGRYGQGQHPAIFVRLGGYNADYQWYIRQGNAFVPASIDTFLADVAQQGQQLDWPDFKRRMEELNEKSNLPAGSGSRSGDIILVMDCKNGYLTEPDDKEILPGWHGGPTKAESEVPLIFNFAYGSASADNQGIITTAIKSVPSFDRDLTPVLVEIVRQSRGTAP